MKPARMLVLLLAVLPCLAPAQGIDLTDLQGRHHTLQGYRGKWVVLNVWATWCAPCIHEMPELEALSKSRTDLVVLGIAADADKQPRVADYARALHVSYPIVAGDPAMLTSFNVRAYPTTMLWNPDGKLVLTKLGQVSRRELESQLPAASVGAGGAHQP